MTPLSGAEPEVLLSGKLPRVITLRRSCLSHTTDVVPRTWIRNILKRRALTRDTAPRPVTSHTQEHPRQRVSSLPVPRKGLRRQAGRRRLHRTLGLLYTQTSHALAFSASFAADRPCSSTPSSETTSLYV